MDADRHQEIVLRVRAMYAGELAGSLAPDFEIHEPESLPYGGFHRGADAGIEFFDSICTFWRDASFELVDVTASDDHAICSHHAEHHVPPQQRTALDDRMRGVGTRWRQHPAGHGLPLRHRCDGRRRWTPRTRDLTRG